MIALPYTILYNIGHYDAIISYFALAKCIKIMEKLLHNFNHNALKH